MPVKTVITIKVSLNAVGADWHCCRGPPVILWGHCLCRGTLERRAVGILFKNLENGVSVCAWCTWCRFSCPMSKPSLSSAWLGQVCPCPVLQAGTGSKSCCALSQPHSLPSEPLITQSLLAWEAKNFLNLLPIPLKGCCFCPTCQCSFFYIRYSKGESHA